MSSSEGFFSPAEQQAEQQGCAASLRALRQDLVAVEKAIKALLAADTVLAHRYERITSVPGVGLVTAAEIMLTTNEFQDSTDPLRRRGAVRTQFRPVQPASTRGSPA